MSAPINNIVIISGANQYFFLTFRNDQISLTKSINASMINKLNIYITLKLKFS